MNPFSFRSSFVRSLKAGKSGVSIRSRAAAKQADKRSQFDRFLSCSESRGGRFRKLTHYQPSSSLANAQNVPQCNRSFTVSAPFRMGWRTVLMARTACRCFREAGILKQSSHWDPEVCGVRAIVGQQTQARCGSNGCGALISIFVNRRNRGAARQTAGARVRLPKEHDESTNRGYRGSSGHDSAAGCELPPCCVVHA